MNRRSNRRLRGFTLVELQIALLIVAVMAALMSGALRLSAKTWATVNKKQDAVEHRYFLSQYLRRHLGNARFQRVTTEDHGSVTGFFGNRQTINFVAPWPAFHNDGELYWWNLGLEWDEDRQQYDLVASYFPYDDGGRDSRDRGSAAADGEEGEDEYERIPDGRNSVDDQYLLKLDNHGRLYFDDVEPSRLVVAKDVLELGFEYFYRDPEGVQKWVEEWQPGNITPLVIRLNLSVSDPGAGLDGDKTYTALPEILISPRFADQKLHASVFERNR